MDTTTLTDTLIALENERCHCIVSQRFDRLAQLLSDRLVHTHARGNVDDKSSYLAFVGGVIESLDLQREHLRVIPLSDCAAVMHGRQINRARKRGEQEEVIVESMATQTWVLEPDGQWRVVAFHASSLGAPPPPVR
jgi:ketosteroid isomerase-like protein